MAIVAKCTFFLRYKSAGVSFSLYSQPANLEALIQKAENKSSTIDRFWKTYLPLLGIGVEAPYVRISNEAVRNDAVFFDTQYVTIGSTNIPSTGVNVVQVKVIEPDEPDFHNTSALVSLAASTTQKGRLFMRFIPDDVVNYPIGLNPSTEWDKGFKKWVALLISDQWCIRCLADDVTNPPRSIANVTRTGAATNMLVTTDDNHGLNVKDIVRLSRVKATVKVNGIWTVDTVPSVTSFTLRNSKGDTLAVGTGGYARKRSIQFPTIANAGYRRVTGRKAGRPFGSPVGRRKAKSA